MNNKNYAFQPITATKVARSTENIALLAGAHNTFPEGFPEGETTGSTPLQISDDLVEETEPGTALRTPHRFNLVSPPFACGVTWLVNLLLALDIRTTNAGFPGHWMANSGASTMSDSALNHLKWHLPVLHTRHSFNFREPVDVVWEHRLDFALLEPCPTIVFVRDPRDAIYSLYRRNHEALFAFSDYLARPEEWPDHFPGLFQLPPFETFAYYCFFWLAMSQFAPMMVVRFEDVKAAPERSARRILDFLGISRSDSDIASAIESSAFQNARKAMEVMAQETSRQFLTARKGSPGEWHKVFDANTLSFTGGAASRLMALLGYGNTTSPSLPNEHWPDIPLPAALLEKYLVPPLRPLAEECVRRCLDGKPLPGKDIADTVEANSISQEQKLRLGALTRAIFYTERLFGDVLNSQRGAALAAFLWLNLEHGDQQSIRDTASRSLNFFLKDQGASSSK